MTGFFICLMLLAYAACFTLIGFVSGDYYACKRLRKINLKTKGTQHD